MWRVAILLFHWLSWHRQLKDYNLKLFNSLLLIRHMLRCSPRGFWLNIFNIFKNRLEVWVVSLCWIYIRTFLNSITLLNNLLAAWTTIIARTLDPKTIFKQIYCSYFVSMFSTKLDLFLFYNNVITKLKLTDYGKLLWGS